MKFELELYSFLNKKMHSQMSSAKMVAIVTRGRCVNTDCANIIAGKPSLARRLHNNDCSTDQFRGHACRARGGRLAGTPQQNINTLRPG